eukprot:CAMPEP_0118723740 /NCGR_PEP_ID=MMETSP0800-20121206/32171_1 /TAXON_ID=210618 ORGANISM="Striatella unipunctata, Strain CCMP2910" /NCGR_SAMPLE_ID=MMETSP0800 /ASSEMBLY_ACC=CAM_ASM_000638 /LENGTH=105 /DNA_ID=CAMNT_0006632199 /DNA_START=153 /DNA_END=470 /DNA_ORIENTATION=-
MTDQKKWKQYGSGNLRLYRHRTDKSKRRMVLRNNVGKVQFNVSIYPNMRFDMNTKNKGGSIKKYITFSAVEDPKEGPKLVMFLVGKDVADELFGHLQALAKKTNP